MNNKEQITRIEQMEKRFDRATKSVRALEKALDSYARIQPELNELIRYYDSGLWRKDHTDDDNGLIPETLKRGVLSEDGVFDLLTDIAAVKDTMAQFTSDD